MTHSTVTIQITPESVPSTPSWLAEVAAFAQVLASTGILSSIQQRVRFARARFGQYDTIDFVIVLIGYALSGEPSLKAFYERLLPFADTFMALFGRHHLPSRSALSRFLAALDPVTVEALRTLFQKDLVARKPFASPGGLWDRFGQQWVVVDVDGTKQAARKLALPQLESLPEPHRRFDQVCAPSYLGRKRGEVGRTRTTILQAHTHQFLGTFGGAGNGNYRGELKRALEAISSYATPLALPHAHMLVRASWIVWQRGTVDRGARFWPRCDRTEQGLCAPGPARSQSSSRSPARGPEDSSGKWNVSCALRLPGYCSHSDGAACAPDRRYPRRFLHERLHWQAARRAGVRIVCDSTSFSRIFPARRAGLVSAPGII